MCLFLIYQYQGRCSLPRNCFAIQVIHPSLHHVSIIAIHCALKINQFTLISREYSATSSFVKISNLIVYLDYIKVSAVSDGCSSITVSLVVAEPKAMRKGETASLAYEADK